MPIANAHGAQSRRADSGLRLLRVAHRGARQVRKEKLGREAEQDIGNRRVQVSDEASLNAIIDKVMSANPKQLAEYRSGKAKVLGFFVGQVMKETKGQANPKIVNELLRKKLP